MKRIGKFFLALIFLMLIMNCAGFRNVRHDTPTRPTGEEIVNKDGTVELETLGQEIFDHLLHDFFYRLNSK